MAKGPTQVQDQTQQQFSTTSGTANTNQSGQVNPFEPAVGLLKRLAGQFGDINPAVTGDQQTAANTLVSGANAVPEFGQEAWNNVQRLFSTDTAPQIGMLNRGLGDLTNNIGATARGENLDPWSVPGFGDAISTAMNDITKKVKGVYAGSGRDPSGAGSFAGSLGRGLTEGIAPTIANVAGQLRGEQSGAAKTLYDATGGTAGAITNQGQVPLTNISQGMGLLPGVVQSFLAPGQAQAGASDYAFNQPIANLMKLLQPALGIGGAGSTTSNTGASNTTNNQQSIGVGHGTVTQEESMMSNILGGLTAAASLYSLSDENAKEDIEPIGKLHNGQNVYSFKYRGSPRTEIGLIAQEVEKTKPEAVQQIGMLKFVDYGAATRDAIAA